MLDRHDERFFGRLGAFPGDAQRICDISKNKLRICLPNRAFDLVPSIKRPVFFATAINRGAHSTREPMLMRTVSIRFTLS